MGTQVFLHGNGVIGWPEETRELLRIEADAPIWHLRQLIEKTLGVPVVQQVLPTNVAGATIANGLSRGIAVNLQGYNQNVWVRRMTLAHELGHLLWDPDPRLSNLRVDDYGNINSNPQEADYVEARANAFAIEFLAPQRSVVETFENETDMRVGLRKVMEKFGVSFTSARYHLLNASGASFPWESLNGVDSEPTDEWKMSEESELDCFQRELLRDSRRGRFASLVVRAVMAKLLTEESAAMYLACSPGEYQAVAETLNQILD